MSSQIVINGRFQQRHISGVERYAHEISKRLISEKRFITPKYPLGQVTGHLWEQFLLPAKIQNGGILWSPANAGPWLVQDQVVTIHDASVFDHPEWFNPTFASWTRLSWKILAKRVKAVITVSNFSRERLKLHLGISNEKIHVVYNGVGMPFEPQSTKRIESVKEKYEIKKPYFLFVGTLEPRKNLAALLEAWKLLNLNTHDLFIAGAEGRVFAPTGHAWSRYAATRLLDHRSVTSVHDADLPALHSGATAFVFPSLYEGFGLPVLEAMACGTPVITSNTTVFPEIFGKAALLIDPTKPEDITKAMQRIVEDHSLADTLRERGFKKARELTWEISAAKTETIIKGIL